MERWLKCDQDGCRQNVNTFTPNDTNLSLYPIYSALQSTNKSGKIYMNLNMFKTYVSLYHLDEIVEGRKVKQKPGHG